MRLRNYYFQIAVSLYATLYFFHHANILIMLYIVLNYKKKFEYGFDMFVIFDFSRLGVGGSCSILHKILPFTTNFKLTGRFWVTESMALALLPQHF